MLFALQEQIDDIAIDMGPEYILGINGQGPAIRQDKGECEDGQEAASDTERRLRPGLVNCREPHDAIALAQNLPGFAP